ncbi:heme o synthase [Pyruvatibacter sp. HU-CL02332]|uniref:heme o synthase n=1 Tax=Pyruvatibacter sp. HU-CL02332 TaxID=3127650 RepID=UPI003101C8D6
MSDITYTQSGGSNGASVSASPATPGYMEADIADYFALLKPRVMSLVIFTGLVGMMIAPGSIHPLTAFTALLCIAVGAGASGALNMWWDADIDAVMERTVNRPIPKGVVSAQSAAAFGATLSAASVFVMAALVGYLPAALLAFTIIFYVVVYTMWLKRATSQNIVIGGLAGALPPAIGWASVTGSLAVEPLVLVAIIFMWTPPHFWALALVRNDDYTRAGVPMLPVVAGPDATRTQILLYSLVLVPLGAAPLALGFGGLVYAVASLGLGAGFLVLAVNVWRHRAGDIANKSAMRLFGFSIFYLFALFASLLIERMAGLAAFAPWI